MKLNGRTKSLIRWIPALILMVVIFSFSAQDAPTSSKVSTEVVELLDPIVEPITRKMTPVQKQDFKTSFHDTVRKSAHFLIFLLLGAAFMFALAPYNFKGLLCHFISVGLSFVYACTDEFHQSFVSGRGPAFTDVLIDTAGALIGVLIFWGVRTLVKKIKNKKKTKKA
ncbi:MAG: VanZ family protein [Clostridia bacterium]|nr:VanZ family protein [Clostridia bacterium]